MSTLGFCLTPPNLRNRTIVVVEDDSDVRRYVSAFLVRSGAKVVTAKNGLEGIEAIKNHSPNMVLSDLKMPEMGGFGLLREIRALGSAAGGNVPVIAMSACVMKGERASVLDAGFQACLPKPFTPDKLLETILAILHD